MQDLSLLTEHGKLNIRVAAWIELEGKLLVCQFPDGNVSLPGGRMQFGEDSANAICREIDEELGATLLEPKLFAIIENFFTYDSVPFHELLFVFKGQISKTTDFTGVDLHEQQPYWMPLEDVHQLKPASLEKLVHASSDVIIHMVNQ